jgi:hypothetical protein
MMPHKINNPLLSFQICLSIPSFFLAIGKEAGRRWEIMWKDVGYAGATASFIAPRCNDRGGKAAGLYRSSKKAQ